MRSANAEGIAWLQSKQAGVSGEFFANLVVDELVTNCIKYAYTDAREHVIEVELQIADGDLTVTVVDDGQPFNPLTVPTPDTSLAIEERPLGGLGLHLLRQLSDGMSYERRGNQNRVVLVKRL
jgi:anti-sigma regulatory factor (Ser/Thr protein kinase)